jgi:hypothetical protein
MPFPSVIYYVIDQISQPFWLSDGSSNKNYSSQGNLYKYIHTTTCTLNNNLQQDIFPVDVWVYGTQ